MPRAGYNKKYRYFITTINKRFSDHVRLDESPPYVTDVITGKPPLTYMQTRELDHLIELAENSCKSNCTEDKTRRKMVRDHQREWWRMLEKKKIDDKIIPEIETEGFISAISSPVKTKPPKPKPIKSSRLKINNKI